MLGIFSAMRRNTPDRTRLLLIPHADHGGGCGNLRNLDQGKKSLESLLWLKSEPGEGCWNIPRLPAFGKHVTFPFPGAVPLMSSAVLPWTLINFGGDTRRGNGRGFTSADANHVTSLPCRSGLVSPRTASQLATEKEIRVFCPLSRKQSARRPRQSSHAGSQTWPHDASRSDQSRNGDGFRFSSCNFPIR